MRRFLLLALFAALATPAAAGCLKCTVKTYVKSLNAHDTEKALSLVADELVLADPRGETTLDREEQRRMLDWDAATRLSLTHDELTWDGETVRGLFTERSDFYELLGIPERAYAAEFRFDGERIREMRLTPTDEERVTLDAALAPFLDWAAARRPAELREIRPAGVSVFDAGSAPTWLALLREWRGPATVSRVE